MATFKAFYEKYWSRDTDVSDSDVTTPERRRRLLSLLTTHLRAGDRVLDLGCGCGGFTECLAHAGWSAIGMDISENALHLARQHAPDVDFRQLDENGTIPSANATFDAVWTTEVLEHVLDVHSFLSEVNRVLRQDGLLILTTPYHGWLKNLLIITMKFDRHFDPQGSHIRYFDRRGLGRCLRGAGFEPITYGGIGRFWPVYRTWWVVARKRGEPEASTK